MPQSMTCPSHFIVTSANTVRAFNIDKCDKCGCDAEGANAVTFGKTNVIKMRSLGSTQVFKDLPELGYCDALDMAVCPACFVEE